MAIVPGARFDRYEILSLLGRGGMGEVYLAQDTRLRRKVALKLLPEQFTQDGDRMRRFEQEAYAASALNHPNIITIYEIGEVEGTHFIATEFIDGKTLRHHLTQERMPLRKALEVATQIAGALAEAHEAGIVHRDIKPENVMLRVTGLVKVLDFGLAKLTESPASIVDTEAPTTARVKTETGAVMGTARYMSPEQARGQKVDVRSDIFSLGVVLYEMIAGRAPFEGPSVSDVIASILTKEPPPLTRHIPEVPVELTRIVAKALCKDREERYQVVKDLLIDLKLLNQELSHEPQSTSDPASAPPSPRALFRSWPLALTGLLAVLLTIFIWSNVGGWRERLLGRSILPPRIESVAVLPLDNFSHDPDQEFFADGMTEALIENLSKIGALRVISRTSVMQYKGARRSPLRTIAKELNVDAVIEGSVQRSGDQVKITAQLILAATDQHLWADSYQRDFRDILALQSEVARAIANQINVKLTSEEQALLAEARPVSPQASEAYLKGLYYFNQAINERSEETLKKSFGYFEQAISLDPNYAQAYAGLGRAYHWLASYGNPEFYPKAKEVLTRALRLDENLAEAHAALAYTIHHLDWDWLGAEREYKRALELNPNLGNTGHHGYALYLSAAGRHDEAIREIKLAGALDPLTLPLKRNVGVIYIQARQFDRAIEQLKNVIDLNPRATVSHNLLGHAYVYKGMYEQGIAAIQKARELSGGSSGQWSLAWAYATSGKRDEAIKVLNELKPRPNPPFYDLASIYAALGDKDQALAFLEKAYEKRSPILVSLKVDPAFDSLHSDPRFQDLLRRIGLTP